MSHADRTYGEAVFIIAVKGAADDDTLQWAERQPASPQPIALDDAKWRARVNQLFPIRFCPIVPGEPPPYASCADAK